MEPIVAGAVLIAVLMAKKSAETASEVLTKDVLEAVLPTVKAGVGSLAAPWRDRVSSLGDRLLARLPAANQENPFEDVGLLEAVALALRSNIVVEEARDQAVAETVAAAVASLPAIDLKIDRRKQQGNVFNDSATANFNAPITQNFS